MNIFITGAESGIGNEVAFRLLQEGHRVFATYYLQKNIERLNQLNNGQNLFLYQLDVTKASQIDSACLSAIQEMGSLDILINVAGIAYFNSPLTTSDAEFSRTLDVNVKGYFYLSKRLLPYLQKSKKAQIINMSSIWGLKGSANMFSYSVSKFAVQGISNSLREFCTPLGIKVSNIILDKVDTDFRDNMTEYLSFSDDQKNLMIKPSDVAESVSYLINSSPNLLVSSITLDAFLWR